MATPSSSPSSSSSSLSPPPFVPRCNHVNALLTDQYQISMAYAYFKVGKHNDHSVFDLFFRTTPFKGQFAIFAGLEEVMRFVNTWRFTEDEVTHIRKLIPHGEEEFFQWLGSVDCSSVRIYALAEGTVCFPRVPLLRVEGPIGICQLLETTLLVLVNFATLVATNAARHRLAAGQSKRLLEFGLRRAQGPDGGMSASYYSYMGGFDGSSNVLAGRVYGIPTSGTMAHSFITSFSDDDELHDASRLLVPNNSKDGEQRDLFALAMKYRAELSPQTQKVGELKSFVSYAAAYPHSTLCLVDTYNTLYSGIPNFVCVALALHELGYRAMGIRLDSGDLAYLSREARKLFVKIGAKYNIDYFSSLTIVASNDLNEATILSLNQQGHEIDVFGIGTQIVTCYNQPALGGVYKLVEINEIPRMKLSEEFDKVTLPCRKDAYRLCVSGDQPVVDLLLKSGSPPPKVGEKILCLHPFIDRKRAFVIPSKVTSLLSLYWDCGRVVGPLPPIHDIRSFVLDQLQHMREDHLRPLNPTPYKVSVDSLLCQQVREMWLQESPIPELS